MQKYWYSEESTYTVTKWTGVTIPCVWGFIIHLQLKILLLLRKLMNFRLFTLNRHNTITSIALMWNTMLPLLIVVILFSSELIVLAWIILNKVQVLINSLKVYKIINILNSWKTIYYSSTHKVYKIIFTIHLQTRRDSICCYHKIQKGFNFSTNYSN